MHLMQVESTAPQMVPVVSAGRHHLVVSGMRETETGIETAVTGVLLVLRHHDEHPLSADILPPRGAGNLR